MYIDDIARIALETNRAYCRTLGDHSQLTWDAAAAEIRESAISGVQAVLEHPEITPEMLHKKWCDFKLGAGWVYGAKKDERAKTHPCLVPYNELPDMQRVKDKLFRAVVLALATEDGESAKA